MPTSSSSQARAMKIRIFASVLTARPTSFTPPAPRADRTAYASSIGRQSICCTGRGRFSVRSSWLLVVAGSSVCFDLSVFEIFAPLAWGGAVLLVQDSKELADLPPDAEPTLINTVPAAMELLQLERLPTSIRVINLAGEPLSPSLVRRVYEKTKAEKVFDLYGPTECTTYSTFALRNPHSPAIIGRPIANTQVYVLDGKQRPVPVGMPGELYLGGAGPGEGLLAAPRSHPAEVHPQPLFSGPRGAALSNRGPSPLPVRRQSRISWTL